MIKHPVVTLLGIVGGSVLVALLLLLSKKVKWLNKEITWPGMPKVGKAVPDDYSYSLEGMVTNYVGKKGITALFYLSIAAGGLCLFGLLDPPAGLAVVFQYLLRAICGVGLVVSVVAAAFLYLWLYGRLGSAPPQRSTAGREAGSLSLPCECGRQVALTEGAAGARVQCACGRTLRVPSLSELRRQARLAGPGRGSSRS
jgi:hypothetical protein